MEENTQVLPADFCVAVLADAAEKGTVPPSLQFAKANFKDDDRVFIYASIGKYNGKVTRVEFFCTNHRVKHAKFFGEACYKDFLELEEEVDIAISEYRRKTFKKISHKQRHKEDEV